MDSQFTNPVESIYLISLTQQKKIQFLQKQIINSEIYTKNLELDLQAMRLTVNRLIKQRTNHEVLAKISENLFRIERRCKEMEECLKDSNAKLLIEMQLRIQQKNQYVEKIRELEIEIELIRKANKDKQQEFTIIVNKLRKYEDIREVMVEQKIGKDSKKLLVIKEEDKDAIIKELSQQLNYQKRINRQIKQEMDKKIEILAFALQNQVNYQNLRKSYMESIQNQKKYQRKRIDYENKVISLEKNKKEGKDSPMSKEKKSKYNINENTKELIKQLKKAVISNKLLESALNESIQKNQELVLNNQILIDSNKDMKQRIKQYREKQFSVIRHKLPKTEMTKTENRKSDSNHLLIPSSEVANRRYSQDDSSMLLDEKMHMVELMKQKQIQQYLDMLKSKEYRINVNQLNKDVNRMSEFLILCVGTKHKQNVLNERQSYSNIIKKQNMKKNKRSLSMTGKNLDRQLEKSFEKQKEDSHVIEGLEKEKRIKNKTLHEIPIKSQQKIREEKNGKIQDEGFQFVQY